MGFQLRSKGSSPCLQEIPLTKEQQQSKNLENRIAEKKEKLASFVPNTKDSINFTRRFQVPNILGDNETQAESISERMFDRQSQGMNIQGYAGSNQGGFLSDTKTIGGTSSEPLSWSDGTKSTVTQEDMKRTLLKFGGAKVVNGVLTPVTTHENTKTINRKQYDVRQNNITKLESLLNRHTDPTNSPAAIAAAKKEKTRLVISNRHATNSKKREEAATNLANRRAMFKTKVEERRAKVVERKAKAEAKKKAKLQNQR